MLHVVVKARLKTSKCKARYHLLEQGGTQVSRSENSAGVLPPASCPLVGVWGLGFVVSGFGVQDMDLGFGVWKSACRVYGLGFEV